MTKDEIDIIILGLLMNGPKHGYQLKQNVQGDYLKHFVSISVGSLYTRLSKFEAEGLIEGKLEPQDKMPDRTVYYITKAGKKRLKELVATPVDISGVLFLDMNSFVTHAIFFDHIGKKERIGVIEPYYSHIQAEIKHAAVSQATSAMHGITFSNLEMHTLGMGKNILEDIARYLEELRDL